MQAPTLFVIAADLTKMQVLANIDESDVGRMRPGQMVRFRVDAYPTEQFFGTVQQVRLNPTTVQNVVTYSTVIDVPNPDLKLKPGMTANVNIEIARKTNVLRIPNAALRFRPTRDTFVALNQEITPDIERALGGGRGFGFGRGGRENAQGGVAAQPGQAPQPAGTATAGQASAAAQSAQGPRGTATAGQRPSTGSGRPEVLEGRAGTPSDQQSQRPEVFEGRGGGDFGGGRGGNMDPEERRRRMQERLAQMSPEERAAFEQRMRERQAQGGFGPGGFGGGFGAGAPAQGADAQNGPNAGRQDRAGAAGRQTARSKSVTGTNASTIDSLFGPLPPVESRGRAWLYINKQLKPVNLRLGISDGTYTEILDSNEIQPGTEVVTNVVTGTEPTQRPGGNPTGNPLLQQPGRGGPGGFGGGGGRGRG
jgi:multidrug efflux pump subunit AcrA (membrane-fusion protein)